MFIFFSIFHDKEWERVSVADILDTDWHWVEFPDFFPIKLNQSLISQHNLQQYRITDRNILIQIKRARHSGVRWVHSLGWCIFSSMRDVNDCEAGTPKRFWNLRIIRIDPFCINFSKDTQLERHNDFEIF